MSGLSERDRGLVEAMQVRIGAGGKFRNKAYREAMARLPRRDFPILPPTTTVLLNLARLATWERLCGEFKLS